MDKDSTNNQLLKFLNRRDLPFVLDGSFKFGRLRYYRLQELLLDDDRIGDRTEGVATTHVNEHLRGNDPSSEAARIRLSKHNLIALPPLGEGADLKINNWRIQSTVDCFVLSCARGPLSTLAEEFSTRGDPAGYDACVAYTDPEKLRDVLWDTGTINGRKISEMFESLIFKEVSYTRAEQALGDGPISTGDPFVKDAKYKAQCEWRFVLIPKQPIDVEIDKDGIFVKCPEAKDLIKEQSFDPPLSKTATRKFDSWDTTQLLSELKTLCLAYERDTQSWFDNKITDRSLPREERNQLNLKIDEARRARQAAYDEAFEVKYGKQLRYLYWEVRTKFPTKCARIDPAILLGVPLPMLIQQILLYGVCEQDVG